MVFLGFPCRMILLAKRVKVILLFLIGAVVLLFSQIFEYWCYFGHVAGYWRDFTL